MRRVNVQNVLGYFVIANTAILCTIFTYLLFQISTLFSNLEEMVGLLFVIIITVLFGIVAVVVLSHILLSLICLPIYFQTYRLKHHRWMGFVKIANLSLGILYIVFSLIYGVFSNIKNILPLADYVKVLWVLVAISMLLVGYFTPDEQKNLSK